MNESIQRFKALLLIAPLSLSACSWLPSKATSYGSEHIRQTSMLASFNREHHDAISDNLLYTLGHLDGLSALMTTVQMSEPVTPFGVALYDRLSNTGYGIQLVKGDLGNNIVRYVAENSETEQGYRTLYRIQIGEHFVEREYTLSKGKLIPSSEMRVSGPSQGEYMSNDPDPDFNTQAERFSYINAQNADEPEIIELKLPTERVIATRSVEKPNVELTLEQSATANLTTSTSKPSVFNQRPSDISNSSNINMYDTHISSFVELFKEYETLETEVLIFPNDSLYLGRPNKETVAKLVEGFDSESHIFSVVGCSHGKTAIDNGNEILANGRRDRIKEALLANGIAEKFIYDEVCYSPTPYDNVMPGRGVVLTMKRRKG